MPGLRRQVIHGRDCKPFIQKRGDHRAILVAMASDPLAVISGCLGRHDPPVHLQDIPKDLRHGEWLNLCTGLSQFLQRRLRCLAHCFIGFCQDTCAEVPKPRRPPGLQWPWRRRAQKAIQEQSEIADLAGHRPDMIQARAHRHDALGTQLAEGRLAGRHAAIRRWPNQRATGLCAQGPQAHAHGQGRGRPAAGATWRVRQVPRIACGRGIKAGKLDGDRLPQDYHAGPTQGSDHRRVGHGWLMPAQRRSCPGGKPLHVNDVLDANGNPVQGPMPLAESCLTGPFGCGLTGSCLINQRPGVDGILVLANLFQALVEQLQRRQRTRAVVGRRPPWKSVQTLGDLVFLVVCKSL